MAEKHDTEAMPAKGSEKTARHKDWRLGGKRGGGGSDGAAYPNPHTGREDEVEEDGFGRHGGQSDMAYYGPEQLGDEEIEPGGNENAGARNE